MDETLTNAAPIDVSSSVKFLTALFDPSDLILFRPIETWVEVSRRRSRVDFHSILYVQADRLEPALKLLDARAQKEFLNQFFGVCPRIGPKGRFDLAWQIRTARSIWIDIDHVSVSDAQKRISDAGLPAPSIIVNSGNGVHVYWLLEQPYLIDDVGDPIPVETEWTKTVGGKNRPRKYVLEGEDKVYLDRRRQLFRMSPKGNHFQDVLAGVANLIGGDHTTDLSRLLRIPGTLNRKNQRNGAEPRLTELIECDPTRRYPFELFERFKIESPSTVVVKQIAKMPLPKTRKVTAVKEDALSKLIASCTVATVGNRSEADFALCCQAIRSGFNKGDVWSKVKDVGKFEDQGESYFDRTWESAEFEVRARAYDEAQTDLSKLYQPNHDETEYGGFESKTDSQSEPRETRGGIDVIEIDTSLSPVSETLSKITDHLLDTDNCFQRTDQLVVVRDGEFQTILTSAELAGLTSQYMEFFFKSKQGCEYKPLPAAYGNTWLNNYQQRSRLPKITLFTHNPVYTEDWRLVASGYDADSGIYCTGPGVEPADGAVHLDKLLADFCFKTPADRTNFIGILLTAILIPRFIGCKPAALFNGNQSELGKTILAQIIAILRDGKPTETATYNPNDEEFEKRLGAIVRRGITTLIIDNAKSQGKNPRIDSACLERSITDTILSYRLLGQSAVIRAENSHIFCITANTPEVSRDLVTRSVVINLYHEGDPKKRTFTIPNPEGYAQQYRLELLGELFGMVERWRVAGMPMAETATRFNKRGWGNIIGGILHVAGEPDFLANAEEAAEQLDETRRDFTELVGLLYESPQLVWTATELVSVCEHNRLLAGDLGHGSARSLSTRMGTIASRFIDARFGRFDDEVVFTRVPGRKGAQYRVILASDLPNL